MSLLRRALAHWQPHSEPVFALDVCMRSGVHSVVTGAADALIVKSCVTTAGGDEQNTPTARLSSSNKVDLVAAGMFAHIFSLFRK